MEVQGTTVQMAEANAERTVQQTINTPTTDINGNGNVEQATTFDAGNIDLGDGAVSSQEGQQGTPNVEDDNLLKEDKKDATFNPEDFNEEDEEGLMEGYSLSAFSEMLSLEDPEDEEFVRGHLRQMQELGFTQQQVDHVIQMQIDLYQQELDESDSVHQEQENEFTHEKVAQRLKDNLTTEEKRNYKSVLSWVKGMENSGVPKEWINDAMGNPALVKMFHALYKGNVNTNSVQEIKQTQTKASQVTPQAVLKQWQGWMGKQKGTVSREQSREFISKYQNMISEADREQFETIFKSILK